MKSKFLFVIASSCALAQPLGANAGVENQVHVGGPDVCEALGDNPGCDKSFSLTALTMSNGKTMGQFQDGFGGDSGGHHTQIDCLSVNGNNAWVSGIVKHGMYGDQDATGWRIATRVADNGHNQEAPFDQISFSWVVGEDFDCHSQPDWQLMDMPRGQVSVR
ncbi:hypothetical protein [Bowmanella sp. JS7-9]|uniref:Secreted protein n=1 Tax=Pseudobowmanella zhangzhouensis TaxID=1537679 RepID=A0ABW1XLK7_9ALTE|nr:hypothetical protein [Bowmanella sp. JS7-9]TBX25609.1 hypothetical protein TK45_02585 [Bowmanella sp. JS7-9]